MSNADFQRIREFNPILGAYIEHYDENVDIQAKVRPFQSPLKDAPLGRNTKEKVAERLAILIDPLLRDTDFVKGYEEARGPVPWGTDDTYTGQRDLIIPSISGGGHQKAWRKIKWQQKAYTFSRPFLRMLAEKPLVREKLVTWAVGDITYEAPQELVFDIGKAYGEKFCQQFQKQIGSMALWWHIGKDLFEDPENRTYMEDVISESESDDKSYNMADFML